MIERTKAKSNFKQGVNLRGVSDNLKYQTAHNRTGKRDEITKRLRTSNVATSGESFSPSALQRAVLAIQSSDKTTSIAGISTLRHFLCEEDPPVEAVVRSGVIDDLVSTLSLDLASTPDAIWCLTNIATGNHAQTGAVVRAVPALLSILSGSNSAAAGGAQTKLCEDVCWAIGNIAGDSDEYRSVLLQYGCLQPMVAFLLLSLCAVHGTGTEAVQAPDLPPSVFPFAASAACATPFDRYQSRARTAMWALSNMARGRAPGKAFLDSGVTAPLLDFLKLQRLHPSPSTAVQTEACWLLAFLTAKEDDTVAALMEQGLAQVMVGVASTCSPSDMGSVPCLRVLVNASSGPSHWLDSIVDQPSLLPALVLLCDVSVAERAVAKESFLLLRNLLGGGVALRQRVLSSLGAPLLAVTARALLSDQFEMQREAAFAMDLTLLEANPFTVSEFSKTEVLRQLIHLLRALDVDLNLCCLQVIRRVVAQSSGALGICAGLGLHDTLDDIQYGPGDSEIRHTARQLAEDLFETEEEEETALAAPPAPTAQYAFGQASGGFGSRGENAPTPSAGRGVGRGSQMNRPAWMVDN